MFRDSLKGALWITIGYSLDPALARASSGISVLVVWVPLIFIYIFNILYIRKTF
jgi:hypothetical protein